MLVFLETLEEFFPTKIAVQGIRKCLDKYFGKYELTSEQEATSVRYLDVIGPTQDLVFNYLGDDFPDSKFKGKMCLLGENLIDKDYGNCLNFKYFEPNGKKLIESDLKSEMEQIFSAHPEESAKLLKKDPLLPKKIIESISKNITEAIESAQTQKFE